MSRLIDAEDIVDIINDFVKVIVAHSEFTKGYVEAHKSFAKLIDEMPTIEQPTWISCAERLPDEEQEVLCLTPDGSFRVFVDDYTGRCTNCHEENLMDWEYEDKFCPNCGARMDLEDNK